MTCTRMRECVLTKLVQIQVYRCRTIWHSCRHHTHHGVVAGYPQ